MDSKFYILQTRPLGIRDTEFAMRTKRTSYSSLEDLEKIGIVKQLEPKWEDALVEALVKTHPTHEKNFEHFLIDPPKDIKPSDILIALRNRSFMIPTLFIVYMSNEKPMRIERIKDYYQLLSLLTEANEDLGLSKEDKIDAE